VFLPTSLIICLSVYFRGLGFIGSEQIQDRIHASIRIGNLLAIIVTSGVIWLYFRPAPRPEPLTVVIVRLKQTATANAQIAKATAIISAQQTQVAHLQTLAVSTPLPASPQPMETSPAQATVITSATPDTVSTQIAALNLTATAQIPADTGTSSFLSAPEWTGVQGIGTIIGLVLALVAIYITYLQLRQGSNQKK